MGESFGNYICGSDDEVVPFITSANVACGFHASDQLVMQKTVAMCKKIMLVLVRILDFRI